MPYLRRSGALPAAGLVTVAALLAGCGSSSAGSGSTSAPVIEVVASTNVYGDIVKQIVGDASAKVSITSFISDPSQDPHSYEADTRNQLKLA
jgi:zinc/manganese transport system substrate-binding protein